MTKLGRSGLSFLFILASSVAAADEPAKPLALGDKAAKGTRVHSVAHWDNSANNPYNPAPEKSVKFGLQTWDEMMVGWVAYVWENPDTPAELAKNPPKPADQFFDRMDRNADDVVSRDELPAQLTQFLKVPEKMNREEFAKFYEEMRKLMPRP